MGAGRRGQDDLVDDAVAEDAVPVYMRKGGGGTVVLSPGMVVLALVKEVGGIDPTSAIEISLKRVSGRPPLLCGVEIVPE